MGLPTELEGVPGAQELFDWFGYWPSFHDAELLSLKVERDGISGLRLHTWEMTRDLDDKGYFKLIKHVVVEFAFEGVTGIGLDEIRHENILMELSLHRKGTEYIVEMNDVYGVSGRIEVKQVSIRLEPGKR